MALSPRDPRPMGWPEVFEAHHSRIASRADLLGAGANSRSLTTAVAGGQLIRVRRDHYALPGTPRSIVQAVRIGGRIGCLSALEEYGVFAIAKTFTHAHLDRAASRTRHPNSRRLRLTDRERDGVEVHWGSLIDKSDGSEYAVGLLDALAQVLMCQHRWHAVASIDNALYLKLISETDLREVFAHLPSHLRPLLAAVDGRAEAGQETVLRMVLTESGVHCEPQVEVEGVGRVDLIVEGCVAVEADSRLAHDGWELHVRDRNRDVDIARMGIPTLRPAYQRTIYTPYEVRDAVLQLVRSQDRVRVSL